MGYMAVLGPQGLISTSVCQETSRTTSLNLHM